MKKAFSLVEIVIALITFSVIIAAMAPIISKKTKLNVKTSQGISSDCSIKFSSDCRLCQSDKKCLICDKTCGSNYFLDALNCVCKKCSDITPNCQNCTSSVCTKCENGYGIYDAGKSCRLCNAKFASNGYTVCNQCGVGYYTANASGAHITGAGAVKCQICEPGWACSGGNSRIACNNGKYSPSAGASVCTNTAAGTYTPASGAYNAAKTCEAGFYCPGVSNRIQCPAGTFSKAGASSCTSCSVYGASCEACNESRCTKCKISKDKVSQRGHCYRKPENQADCSKGQLYFNYDGGRCIDTKNVDKERSLPNTVDVYSANGTGNKNASYNKACWSGTTSNACTCAVCSTNKYSLCSGNTCKNFENTDYSACKRTVCVRNAARLACEAHGMKIPTIDELNAAVNAYKNTNLSQNVLNLCDKDSDKHGYPKCASNDNCTGAADSICYPYSIVADEGKALRMSKGANSAVNLGEQKAVSVRCVKEWIEE